MTKTNNKNEEHSFSYDKLSQDDLNLVEAAMKALRANFHPMKHQVGCAVKVESGKVYTGVNIQSSIYGPCAEVIALGSALANGEKNIVSIVAVKKVDDNYPIVSPCGSCRQLILDYAHNATVIFNLDGHAVKTTASNLLPGSYENSFTTIARSSSRDLS